MCGEARNYFRGGVKISEDRGQMNSVHQIFHKPLGLPNLSLSVLLVSLSLKVILVGVVSSSYGYLNTLLLSMNFCPGTQQHICCPDGFALFRASPGSLLLMFKKKIILYINSGNPQPTVYRQLGIQVYNDNLESSFLVTFPHSPTCE